MTVRELRDFLQEAPILQGETLNLDFLPSYKGWSMSAPRTRLKTDILGNITYIRTLKLLRRCSPADNSDRLAALEELEALVLWACGHTPENTRITVTAPPAFRSRTQSGTEEVEAELKVES